jgi:glucose-6-phosphate dehydrogenase assembly protein OpcA
MATVYKVLGQSSPSATTATTLYTVPASTSTVVSTITVANLTGSAATFRISVRPAGAAQTNAMYIAYDVTVGANDTTTLPLGLTLATTDVITVYASAVNLAFNAYGSEIA